MRQYSVPYTFLFSAAVCGVCAIFVASSAVSLEDLQDANVELSRKRNVLEAAGKVKTEEKLTAEEIEARFETFEPVIINLEEDREATEEELAMLAEAGFPAASFDQQKVKKDPKVGKPAPQNYSNIIRVPKFAQLYKVKDEAGNLEMFVLPIEGYGLWSTLYGYVAVDSNTSTVRGLTYYDQKETAGLGGEVDNPRWKALWPGREIYGDDWEPEITVVKGGVGPASEEPYKVDGLSGATITSRGVTNMLHFWFGDNGFGPYLESYRKTKGAA